MAPKIISILTGCGNNLGNGHLQRMLNLLWFLNQQNDTCAFIIINNIDDYIPHELKPYIQKNIYPKSDLIIRDMRDSSASEITKLKSIAKVLVIDDLGDGRDTADYSMNLLPNLIDKKNTNEPLMDFFIYGYNFSQTMIPLFNKKIIKDFDFIFYPGFNREKKYLEKVQSLIPISASLAVLSDDKSYMIKNGENLALTGKSYSEILLSGKAIITHFGITLFEAFISECRLITLNPTEYHSQLTEKTKESIDILNLGVYDNFNFNNGTELIKKALEDAHDTIGDPKKIYSMVLKNLQKFYQYIIDL